MAMFTSQLRTIWRKWSLTSLFQKKDKRQIQQEIDIHRLFLFTSFNRIKDYTDEKVINEIVQSAEKIPFEVQQEQVQANIHEQIRQLAHVLGSILHPEVVKRSEVVAEKRSRPSGLSFCIHGSHQNANFKQTHSGVETHPYSRAQVSDLLKKKLGYTLELKPSAIPHSEAGEGLFLNGSVRPGAVVSLYPGIIYTPSQYRYIPGYPRIDINNPYLIARYDGVIIDGKPWGRGGESREWWNGNTNETSSEFHSNETRSEFQMEVKKKTSQLSWWKMFGEKSLSSVSQGETIERRNPLALAHFANHPTREDLPNVMVCSYDFFDTELSVRPYIPNVLFADDEDADMQRRGVLWVNEGKKSRPVIHSSVHEEAQLTKNTTLKSLVLVATREIKDEEILLNYRLSNQKKRPSWYSAVDEEEDKRRWS